MAHAFSREVANKEGTMERITVLQLVESGYTARLPWHLSPSTWSNPPPSLEDHIIPSKHAQLKPFYKKAVDSM